MGKKIEVPVWERFTITLDEASQYFGIGTSKLRELSNGDNCPFVLWVGSKRLIKRKKLEEYLSEQESI
ncbi:MAG: transposase [Eubacteriales Family XIII. Incertae Sedis bacterium]|nr:MAG: transposase [Clostridiales Family XIII bacterium]